MECGVVARAGGWWAYRTRDGRCSAARRRPHTPMRRGREFPPFSPHQCTHARHKYQSHARTYVYNKRRSPGSWCACLELSASRAASSPPVRGSQEFRRSSAARDAVTQEVAHFRDEFSSVGRMAPRCAHCHDSHRHTIRCSLRLPPPPPSPPRRHSTYRSGAKYGRPLPGTTPGGGPPGGGECSLPRIHSRQVGAPQWHSNPPRSPVRSSSVMS